jgi:hypothetical protein
MSLSTITHHLPPKSPVVGSIPQLDFVASSVYKNPGSEEPGFDFLGNQPFATAYCYRIPVITLFSELNIVAYLRIHQIHLL